MKAARNRRRKSRFVLKLKTFLVYSFISIVVLGFFLNTFISNILEYSFALANTGGIVDIKKDEKYSVVLISSNKLNELKEISLITYDKKNRKLSTFELNHNLMLLEDSENYPLSRLLIKNDPSNPEKINRILSDAFGTNLAFTYITSSDNLNLFKKLILGQGSLLDLYEARNLPGVSLRDLYFIYSFAGSVDSKDKRTASISSYAELDKELRDIYIDSVLGEEGLSITVINSTTTNGLGRKYTRLINNLGGRVVDTASAEEPVSQSFIIYKEQSPSVNFLASSLGISKSLDMEEVGLKYPEIIKSDLVIVLGIDKGEL